MTKRHKQTHMIKCRHHPLLYKSLPSLWSVYNFPEHVELYSRPQKHIFRLSGNIFSVLFFGRSQSCHDPPKRESKCESIHFCLYLYTCVILLNICIGVFTDLHLLPFPLSFFFGGGVMAPHGYVKKLGECMLHDDMAQLLLDGINFNSMAR